MISSKFDSQLHDEKTFYPTFLKDLERAQSEVIIESPFITTARVNYFIPTFERLLNRGVKIYVITRCLEDLDEILRDQSEREITRFEVMGVQPLLLEGNHHRKLVIIDRKVLWEGSLNILSQSNSVELMFRFEDNQMVNNVMNYLDLKKFL